MAPISRPGRVDLEAHQLDRACIGHCFSYANAEPATLAFRIRASENNPFIIGSYLESTRLQLGKYRVRPQDLPLYEITPCGAGQKDYCAHSLQAGEIVREYTLDGNTNH